MRPVEIPVVFYRTAAGVEPVREWLRGLTSDDLLFVRGGRIGVLHGFIKKTRATPPDDIELARKRMKDMKT